MLLLSSCLKMEYYKWQTDLNNGYMIGQFDKDLVQVRKKELTGSYVVIPETIKEYTVTSEFVITRNCRSISINNILCEEYYILNMKNGSIYGPYREMEELKKQINDLKISGRTSWKRVYPYPINE